MLSAAYVQQNSINLFPIYDHGFILSHINLIFVIIKLQKMKQKD